jgi:hypothetical protein
MDDGDFLAELKTQCYALDAVIWRGIVFEVNGLR